MKIEEIKKKAKEIGLDPRILEIEERTFLDYTTYKFKYGKYGIDFTISRHELVRAYYPEDIINFNIEKCLRELNEGVTKASL